VVVFDPRGKTSRFVWRQSRVVHPQAVRFLPVVLAVNIAMSARLTRAAADSRSLIMAMPMLRVTPSVPFSVSIHELSVSVRTRCASVTACSCAATGAMMKTPRRPTVRWCRWGGCSAAGWRATSFSTGVSGVVPVIVIDVLEVVDIGEQHREVSLVATVFGLVSPLGPGSAPAGFRQR
jgi:hypothetical protein